MSFSKQLLTSFLVVCIIPSFAFAQQEDEVDSSCLDFQTSLFKLGSRDAGTSGEVSELQDFLVDSGYLTGSPTGYYGIKTVAAVKKYQSVKKIKPTGSVGVLTKAMIKADTCSETSSSSVSDTATQKSANTTTTTNSSGQSSNYVPVLPEPVVSVKPVQKNETTTVTPNTSSLSKEGLPKPPINIRYPEITALDNNPGTLQSQKVMKNVCWDNVSTSVKVLVLKGWTKESSGTDKEFLTQTVQSNYPVWFSKQVCTAVILPLNGKTVYFTMDATNDAGTVRSEPSNYVLAEIPIGETPVVDLPKVSTLRPNGSLSGLSPYENTGLFWSVTQADYCELYKGDTASGAVIKKTSYTQDQKYSQQNDEYMYSGLVKGQTFSYTVSCTNTKTKETTTKTSTVSVE